LLNLNSATADDFEALPGIGPVLAQRIVTWRDANGPFTAVEELREVSGIGDSTYADLSLLVRI
jgi:competence protein ComEA